MKVDRSKQPDMPVRATDQDDSRIRGVTADEHRHHREADFRFTEPAGEPPRDLLAELERLSITDPTRRGNIHQAPATPELREEDGGYFRLRGTDGRDRITLEALSDGRIRVKANGEVLGVLTAEEASRLRIEANGGNDRIWVDQRITVGIDIHGGAGDDLIYGGGGNDYLFGGEGNDRIKGRGGDDNISGFEGNDELQGGDGDDTISGGQGDDTMEGGNGVDRIMGGDGNDKIRGGRGDDFLWGDGGDDAIEGGYGDDHLYGNDGNDTLHGGPGDDTFDGGTGRNTLYIDAAEERRRARERRREPEGTTVLTE